MTKRTSSERPQVVTALKCRNEPLSCCHLHSVLCNCSINIIYEVLSRYNSFICSVSIADMYLKLAERG